MSIQCSRRYPCRTNDVHLHAHPAQPHCAPNAGALQTPMISSAHLQPPDLVQMQLEAAVHLPDQIAVVQNNAHFVGFTPPESLHQLLFAPFEEVLVGEVGNVFGGTFLSLGSRQLRLCLLRLCFLHQKRRDADAMPGADEILMRQSASAGVRETESASRSDARIRCP